MPCGVWKLMHASSWRAARRMPIGSSHGVGIAHALVWRSPIS